MARTGRPPKPPVERFWRCVLVNEATGCWEWTGSKSGDGYARFTFPGGNYAHRFSYETYIGSVPDGLVLDHLCRNTGCVNPEHLEPVTQRENILRGEGWAAQNARKTHCSNGHPFDGSNLHLRRDGARGCCACYRQKAREAYRQKHGVDPSQFRRSAYMSERAA